MAENLARIFGTEKDKVNCPFYFKIGACRHGDMCSRLHNKPTISETVLLKNMYQNPLASAVSVDGSALEMDEKELQHHFEEFYEDVFAELSNFGKLEQLHVCDNLGDHLLGNVYAKFKSEEDADKALKGLTGRFYAGRPIMVEFSPVTDFKEARCRQFDVSDCTRGGYCNFMHLKQIGPELSRKLFGTSRPPDGAPRRGSPDRRDGGRGGGGGGGGDRGERREYRRDDRGGSGGGGGSRGGDRDYRRDDRRDDYRRDDRRDDYRRDDRPRDSYSGGGGRDYRDGGRDREYSRRDDNNSSQGGAPQQQQQQQQAQQQYGGAYPPQQQQQQQPPQPPQPQQAYGGADAYSSGGAPGGAPAAATGAGYQPQQSYSAQGQGQQQAYGGPSQV